MQTHKLIPSLLVIFSLHSFAADEVVGGEQTVSAPQNSSANAKPVASINTFERLLELQGQAEASSLEAKIRMNNSAGVPASKNGNSVQDGPPVDANPLLNANQRLLNSEPTLEAIWGLAGREVAEINYKGQRVAVSMRSPVVSKDDGWELAEIQPFQVVLIQRKGKKGVVNRKEIPLNWQGHIGGIYPTPAAQANQSPAPASTVPGFGVGMYPANNAAVPNPGSFRPFTPPNMGAR